MGKESEKGIRRVKPLRMDDPPDAVEMDVKCGVTNFKVKGGKTTGVGSQMVANCKVMASFDKGVLSVSMKGARPIAISLRLDEVMALLKEAAAYNGELEGGEGEDADNM